jgi:hypothetical protein
MRWESVCLFDLQGGSKSKSPVQFLRTARQCYQLLGHLCQGRCSVLSDHVENIVQSSLKLWLSKLAS